MDKKKEIKEQRRTDKQRAIAFARLIDAKAKEAKRNANKESN